MQLSYHTAQKKIQLSLVVCEEMLVRCSKCSLCVAHSLHSLVVHWEALAQQDFGGDLTQSSHFPEILWTTLLSRADHLWFIDCVHGNHCVRQK